MSKTTLSPSAIGLIGDIKNCVVTNTTKARVIEQSAKTYDEMISGKYDSSMSTIEGLGARALMSFLPHEEIQKLVDDIHNTEQIHREFLTDKETAYKGQLSAARTEAALKGFVLPVSLGGPYDEISRDLKGAGITDAEAKIAFDVTKKMMLELAGQELTSEEYLKQAKERYSEILKRDYHELAPDRVEAIQEYVDHGIKKKQGQSLPELEKVQIREAALKTRQEFSKIFNSHEKNILTTQVASSIMSGVIKQIEEKQKIKLTPEMVEQITQALVPTLAKLDSDYLKEKKELLTKELVSSLQSGRDHVYGLVGSYKIVPKELGNIAKKIDTIHQPQALEFFSKKIESAMLYQNMTNQTIADKLNSFTEATGITTKFDAKTLPSTKDIVKLRQSNPKIFDTVFNAKKISSQVMHKVQEIRQELDHLSRSQPEENNREQALEMLKGKSPKEALEAISGAVAKGYDKLVIAMMDLIKNPSKDSLIPPVGKIALNKVYIEQMESTKSMQPKQKSEVQRALGAIALTAGIADHEQRVASPRTLIRR